MYPSFAQRVAHRERALELARELPADASLGLESAAIVSGLPTYDVPAAVQVVRAYGRPVRTSDMTVYVAALTSRDRAIAADVSVTSLARTAVDLGRRRPFSRALIAADAAMRRGATREQMQQVLRSQWTWPRIRHAMPVVREADALSESALESYIRARCIELQLPRPKLQRWLGDKHAPIGRVDFWWEEFGLVGEADGRLKYDPDPDPDDNALRREKDREERLRDAGVEVIRWSWRQAHVSDNEFRERLEAAMRRGLANRIARHLADQLLPRDANVIDLRRFSLLRLT